MNDLAIKTGYELPTKFEDLSKFVLIGREKLVAIRAEIRAIDKVGIAQEVRKQKLEEAQYISEAVLDTEVKIGELMKALPKASGGDRRSKNFKRDSGVPFEKSKGQEIKDVGFNKKQAQRFEALASNPELVERAKAEARANDDIVSRSQVLSMIKAEKRKGEMSINQAYNEIKKAMQKAERHEAISKQLEKRHEYTLYKNIHKIAVYKPVAISRIEAYISPFEQIKNAFLQ